MRSPQPACVCIAPAALLDTVVAVPHVPEGLFAPGEEGGSRRVSAEEVNALLDAVHAPRTTTAGGSAANVARGLAALGSAVTLVCARAAVCVAL